MRALEPIWQLFEREVFPAPSSERLFNPYRDRHDAVDLPDAPSIRRENLRRYLGTYPAPPAVLLVAEAPGPWGCRFSGVPLVSEAQLVDERFPIDGLPSSTKEAPHTEYSGNIYWRVLRPYFPHFFTWNCVPLHPHRPGEPFTIRPPSAGEVRAFAPVLEGLVAILRPQLVLAVGRKAERSLTDLGIEAPYVRHPSQGGARIFEETVVAHLRALDLPAVA